LLYISRCRKMCKVASFKNFENSLTTVKVMTKTKVAPFYLGHGVFSKLLRHVVHVYVNFS